MRSMHCSMTAFDLFRTRLLFAAAWAGTFAGIALVARGPRSVTIAVTLIGIAFGYVVGYRWGISPEFRSVHEVPRQD